MDTLQQQLVLIPILPLVGAVINGLFGHRFPRWLVSAIALGTVLGSGVFSVLIFEHLYSSGEHSVSATLYTWINSGTLSLDIRFMADHLSGVMLLVITGVGFLIHLYSVGYMSHDPGYGRYFAYLNLFTFAMLILVLGDSLPLLFVGWEGVGLCSYLLIGFWFTDMAKAQAGKKAFVVNRVGDFGFLIAMFLLFNATGTLTFEGLRNAANGGQISMLLATGVCLMLLLGASGKSAQIPLYVWLPDAMAGPTPVSALIHAATMVTAGVYLTARLGFIFVLSPIAMISVAVVGATTALFAASIGTTQNDIKKVLAYSTVSQLGFMFMAAGVGAYGAAMFHVVTHAFFKACLFLGSGSVIHGMSEEQDMRKMGGLWKKMPFTFATMFVATLAITGFPMTSGFISKDGILWSVWSSSMGGPYGETFASIGKGLWVVGVLAAALTSFYMWRLIFMTFFSGKLRANEEVASHVHESPWTMTLPLVILGVASLGAGFLNLPHVFGGHEPFTQWLSTAVGAAPMVEGDHTGLEYGLMGTATALAVVAFAIAFVLYARGIHPFTQGFISQRPGRWIYERLLDKWHIDELYEATVVRPINWVSRVVLYEGVDRRFIDLLVDGVGKFAKAIGYIPQLFHSGNIQRYLAIFIIALAVLIYGWLTPFTAKQASEQAKANQAAAAAQKELQVADTGAAVVEEVRR